MEFTESQNLNFKNLSKSSSLAVFAFSIFGLINVLGFTPVFGWQTSTLPILFTVLSIILIFSCFFSAIAFKKASTNFSLIVTTENNDLALLTFGGQQLQKAFTWAAVTVLIILIRSFYFHANFDLVLRKAIN